ncbi:MAG TPA: TolC family protein, partial [Acidiferrobacteraceae bacterium]|nr:TolC family protein [Acidiferrobacteraceae bacterium]
LTLPVSLPSALLRARPDLRGDEALLRAANAAVGEAIVRMYPNLNLTGSFGGASDVPGDLFLPVNRVWSIIAGVTAPLFDGGTLEARKQAQVAAYQGAIAAYQTAVLSAFEQVANALRALEYDRRILALERRALKASGKALVLARQQYRDGAVQYLTVLTAEIANSDARIAYERARAQRYLDTSALLVATGGGGSARALATQPSLSSTASAPGRTPSP